MNDEIDSLIGHIDEFVYGTTNWKTYRNMTDEQRAKYREMLVLKVLFAFSPRKNYDISKATIREWIGVMLKVGAEVNDDDEDSL